MGIYENIEKLQQYINHSKTFKTEYDRILGVMNPELEATNLLSKKNIEALRKLLDKHKNEVSNLLHSSNFRAALLTRQKEEHKNELENNKNLKDLIADLMKQAKTRWLVSPAIWETIGVGGIESTEIKKLLNKKIADIKEKAQRLARHRLARWANEAYREINYANKLIKDIEFHNSPEFEKLEEILFPGESSFKQKILIALSQLDGEIELTEESFKQSFKAIRESAINLTGGKGGKKRTKRKRFKRTQKNKLFRKKSKKYKKH